MEEARFEFQKVSKTSGFNEWLIRLGHCINRMDDMCLLYLRIWFRVSRCEQVLVIWAINNAARIPLEIKTIFFYLG